MRHRGPCAVHSAIHVRCSPATCSTARCLLAISLFVESPSGSSSGRSAGVPARGATTRNPHKARHAAACRTRTPRRDPGRSWCPARLDRIEAGGAVVQQAGQDHPDGARPHFDRDAAKQRIDCRPREVLLGTAHEAQHRAFDDQMAIRRGHVDFAWQVGLAVPCMYCMKRARRTQQRRQETVMRPDVQDDRDRGLQVARKPRNEGAKRIDATRRRTDCDEVPMSQCASDIPAVSSVDPHRPHILHFF